MATMTIPEAYYVVYDVVAPALLVQGHRHHPVSALEGYDIVQICAAFKLLVANEFALYADRNAFEEKVGEEKFAEGVKLYQTGALNVVGSNFVADDQVDVIGAKPAFEFDDPRFLSQETVSSFAKYCRSVGAHDSMYWQKIYMRLGLEYTSTSPRGNNWVEPAADPATKECAPTTALSNAVSGQLPQSLEHQDTADVEEPPRVGEALAGRASEQQGPKFSPMLVLIAVLLVVLGTTQSTRPWLLVLGICNVLVVVHLGGYIVTGCLAGASIEKVQLFWDLFGGTIATMRVENVALSIGWLPLGGSVRFRHSEGSEPAPHDGSLNRLPLAWRLTIHASGLLALFLLACLCIGAEDAAASVFHGLYQVLAGAMAPLSLGQALVRRAVEMPQRDGLVFAFGVLAAKLAAGNLIPLGSSNGWHVLTQVVPERYRESKAFSGIMLLGLFCWLGLAVGWSIAICKAAIIAFQGS